ncbi:Nucleoside-triphosphatase [Thalictrum thalictroides]|uniref:Nucleoside-triphosphatase n=1 Tax=Thalictrum thalictroides TaxID=46969 RepID=A0A7J6VGC4_THATH|nr:Nucleoside-triphosphatase [Thalictrum thalictroides]
MRRSNARTVAIDQQQSNNMDSNMKYQFRPNTSSTRSIFSRFSNSSSNSKSSKPNLLMIIITLVISLFVFIVVKGFRNSADLKTHYRIFIDGGSTGTRIHVFKVLGSSSFDFGKEGLVSMRVNPGLSSFEEEPFGAGRSLLELLEFGKSNIPKDYWGETEIRLMATAGLRRLEVGVQEKILESCRRVLRSSGFKFQDDWASVITGM